MDGRDEHGHDGTGDLVPASFLAPLTHYGHSAGSYAPRYPIVMAVLVTAIHAARLRAKPVIVINTP